MLLGRTVTPVPRWRAWELVAQAAAVDRLSGGRLVLGVGDRADRAFAVADVAGGAVTGRGHRAATTTGSAR
ncbi:alkanesulfonate monooxygenase SsuD/methylene tetrahydromethanopterin reductase-like flavin-dependent oxidoreductase (luciferase family) [Catenuloplanes niger]|uniref:Alkanesulfonate monooxygenase SsuD/methylene tetrahydromethanopterin reductase-like flavin-dependent oxidoreductase (Luciferase family) n=1 Tax=Catenuloplanes niger TaxID=587534 RepID=A0AAE3ZZJ2_9ACTN|nr:alkanesulfonate monooxygenase SsuD/methylene tetrahydromethanopterin reductase-like flavin-dependent oxidoreductase (luciferase family) [Catenuloplanes niger]